MIYFKTYGGYLYNNITDVVIFKYADWECELFHVSRNPPESILYYVYGMCRVNHWEKKVKGYCCRILVHLKSSTNAYFPLLLFGERSCPR